MTEPLSPGVYIEEIKTPINRIEGVDTQTALMIGVTAKGPELPTIVNSYAAFIDAFGSQVEEPSAATRDHWLLSDEGGQWWQFAASVRGFFDNGGQQALIKRLPTSNPEDLTPENFAVAIQSLTEAREFSLCTTPGIWSSEIQAALIECCESRGDCFAILDPPPAFARFARGAVRRMPRFTTHG